MGYVTSATGHCWRWQLIAHWHRTFQNHVRSSNSSCNKDQDLFGRRGEEKCPAELMQIIKPKPSISKLSLFRCTVFMRRRDRNVSQLESKAWKKSLWVTLKETTDTWCTLPTEARLWQFEMWPSKRGVEDAKSVNTQELGRDPSDVEEVALDKEFTELVGRYQTRSHWNTVTQRTSYSERQLVSVRRHWSKRTGTS